MTADRAIGILVNRKKVLAKSLAVLGVWGGCVGMLSPVWAQSSTAPVQTTPGLQAPSSPLQEQLERRKQQDRFLPGPSQASPDVRLDAPGQEATVSIQATQFPLKQVVVENATMIPKSHLDAITRSYEGRDVTLSDLQAMVEKINAKYREKGFLTTQAYIPPQDVQSGVVTIKVVEGRVGTFCITGNTFNRTKAIARHLNLHPGDPFNLKRLEKDLNRTNRFNANYRLKATLSPGTESGETNVRIDVAEKQPWQITPTLDNQGRPFIGTVRGGVELTNDSLFGWGDRLSARYLTSGRTNIALGSYAIPLSRWGDQLSVNYGYSHVDVKLGTPNPPDITGRAHNVGLLFTHPFDENRYWIGDIGFNFREVASFFNGTQDLRDGIRTVQLGLTFNHPDRYGTTFARLQNTFGIAFLGGNRAFYKAEGFLTRIFILPASNLLILRGYAQLTPNDLPGAEAIQVGGAYSVRGYSEGALVGDRGYSLTIEDRFPIPFLSRMSPWLGERLQGAAFLDLGQAFYDTSNRSYSANRSEFMLGVGFGLRARLTQYLQGFVDLGFGLASREAIEPAGAPFPRIHFGIRSDLLPVVYKSRSDKSHCLSGTAKSAGPKSAANPQTKPALKQAVKQKPVGSLMVPDKVLAAPKGAAPRF